jgi:hypothetical protein
MYVPVAVAVEPLEMLREYNALHKESAQLGFTLLCPFDLPRWEQELG